MPAKTKAKASSTSTLKSKKWLKIGLPVVAILLVAGIGTYLIRMSSAATGSFNTASKINGYYCARVVSGKYPATIKQGSRGDCVKVFQSGYNNWSDFRTWVTAGKIPRSNVAVDGVFGTSTTNAARTFQQANGLPADGIIGKNTWDVFLRNCAVTASCNGK